jgi:hypothetical protein
LFVGKFRANDATIGTQAVRMYGRYGGQNDDKLEIDVKSYVWKCTVINIYTNFVGLQTVLKLQLVLDMVISLKSLISFSPYFSFG